MLLRYLASILSLRKTIDHVSCTTHLSMPVDAALSTLSQSKVQQRLHDLRVDKDQVQKHTKPIINHDY